MSPIPTSLRQMRPEDLAEVLDWAAAEGWNPGIADAGAFLGTDPGGFFVVESEGRPLAAISVVNHSPEHAFLGLYICRPQWRGRGLGRRLWSYGLAHAGARSVGLDGVAAQEARYARAGFVRVGVSVRYEGRIDGATDPHIRAAGPADMPALVALDAAAGGHSRTRFLKGWLSALDDRQSLVLAGGAGAGPAGFATIRRCRTGAKIGPVIAPDATSALRLIRACVAALPAGPVWIDLPGRDTSLAGMLEAAGFAPGFTTARMYRGMPPQRTAAVQAIATMELG